MKSLIRKGPLTLALAIAVIVFANAANSLAATLLVDPDATGCATGDLGPFVTIQGALSAAQTGDTIFVCPDYTTVGGVNNPQAYQGPILLNIPNLTIIGVSDNTGNGDSRVLIASSADTTAVGGESRGIVTLDAANITFGNFTVDGDFFGSNNGTGAFNGIVVTDDAAGSTVFNTSIEDIFNDSVATSQSGQGILVEGGTTASPANILNNVMEDIRSNGIRVGDDPAGDTDLLVRANVRGNSYLGGVPGAVANPRAQAGIVVDFGASADVFNNRLTSPDNIGSGTCNGLNVITICAEGIRLDAPGTTGLVVRFNVIQVAQVGIFAQNTSNANINNNQIVHTRQGVGRAGIVLRGADASTGSNFNIVQQNVILNSRNTGILVGQSTLDTTTGNTIRQNTIQSAFIGIQDFGVSTGIGTGATANTFIQVDNHVLQ